MWVHKDGVVTTTYTADRVLETLFPRVINSLTDRADMDLLASALVTQLGAVEGLGIEAHVGTAFRLGYYYRLFLERNDVVYPQATPSSKASQ